MAAFLLLHGGRHGAWCWERVRAVLEADGHRVAAPDLPGRDGSPTTIDDAVDAAEQALVDLGPATVVAHSFGGATATLLASRRDDLVLGVLFAAAAIPRPGRAVALDAYGPVLGRLLIPLADHDGALGRMAARWFFCHRLGAADRQWLLDRLVTERSDVLGTRPFPTYSLDGVPCRYVLTVHDRLLPRRRQVRYARRVPDAVVVVMDSGHSVFAERPVELARVAAAFAAELD